ncbi:DUF998 domain-containing protein [Pseudactinotalea suaedae]|uniref:DUF998 domain-containing protein n=1 Tax=Pseudactinotalea suaedae TaxID=1524924 RepID=UPI0012E136E7|nr:DUF998 domain-containing protein [Pseudactinotalea suaedae]
MSSSTRTARPLIPTRAGTVSTPQELTADRVTKSLLGYGVIAGPIYVVTSLVQASLRDGFDLTRHAWSQLALGDPGWVQVVNLVLTGAMLIAFAVGLARALVTGPGSRWSPLLIGVFGLSMIVSGIFKVDPAGGFPDGLPTPATISTSGLVHLGAGAVGFTCLTAGLLVLARRLSREGFSALAVWTRVVAVAFLVTFVGMASTASGGAGIIAFVVAVVAVMALLSVLAVHRYRQMPNTDG